MQESQLIERYFNRIDKQRDDVRLGIGDDAAIVAVPADHELVISVDMLLAGVHFLPDWDPVDIGYRALAVNLSDMAAMGAVPCWATLALSLPEVNESWIADFSQGFLSLADQYHVQLIGGDLVHGPLAISVQIHGLVAQGKALRRNNAVVGDVIYVTGKLGTASFALRALQDNLLLSAEEKAIALPALWRPQPRVAVGQAIMPYAHAAIDVSDGLAGDLGYVLQQSGVGATIQWDRIPKHAVLLRYLSAEESQQAVLHGGDDYELCFTVPSAKVAAIESLSLDCDIHAIGVIEAQVGLRIQQSNGNVSTIKTEGYQHFL